MLDWDRVVHHVGCYCNDFDYFGKGQVDVAGRTAHFRVGNGCCHFVQLPPLLLPLPRLLPLLLTFVPQLGLFVEMQRPGRRVVGHLGIPSSR